ncbi:hypothetical protein [Bdellovibrio sp. HCB2-146]|uniref:hypothetical protein n=1 Tax=Bdellovibrio sp. HCB2-146 TaxID=3394362 RepID=UPI0039BC7A10
MSFLFVTNAETFFRHLFKELIEKEPDKLHSAAKILDDHLSKKDLVDTIVAMGIKKVSIGEIFSHAVSISSVDQIIRYFDVITEGKTKENLKRL